MITTRLAATAGLAVALTLGGCATTLRDNEKPEELTLIVHDSFADGVTDETFAGFTEEWGIASEVLAVGDAGNLVNQAVLTKDNPLADVLFGVDDTFLSRALDNDIFSAYESRHIGNVPDEFIDPESRVTPIDYGDVCLNYDKKWFEDNQVQVPSTLDDLRTDVYAGLLAVESPATSSPGLAFLLATIAEYGEGGWLDFWADLRDNEVTIARDWNSAYYGDFTQHGGENSMVVSYASSPPAEVIFAAEPLDESPTGVIEGGCYRQVEFAGVLAGTEYPEAAGLLVDYMLSAEFQETIPLTWFVFPVNSDAGLPQDFVDHTVIPESPARLDAEVIAENRERWTDEWIAVMEG
jgi:thiamine transport system substrate-binding protein